MHSCPLIAGSLEQTQCAKNFMAWRRLLSQLFQSMHVLTRLPPSAHRVLTWTCRRHGLASELGSHCHCAWWAPRPPTCFQDGVPQGELHELVLRRYIVHLWPGGGTMVLSTRLWTTAARLCGSPEATMRVYSCALRVNYLHCGTGAHLLHFRWLA